MQWESRLGTSGQRSGEPAGDGEQQLESGGAPGGEGRIGDRRREVFAVPYLEPRLAEKVGSGVFVVEGCGHSLHLVASDVDFPCGGQPFEGRTEVDARVTAHRSTPPLADLGRESDATREPRSCRVHPDPQRGCGALVGALPGGEEQMVLVARRPLGSKPQVSVQGRGRTAAGHGQVRVEPTCNVLDQREARLRQAAREFGLVSRVPVSVPDREFGEQRDGGWIESGETHGATPQPARCSSSLSSAMFQPIAPGESAGMPACLRQPLC